MAGWSNSTADDNFSEYCPPRQPTHLVALFRSTVSVDHIHVQPVVRQLLIQRLGTIFTLQEHQNRWPKPLLNQLTDRKKLTLLLVD